MTIFDTAITKGEDRTSKAIQDKQTLSTTDWTSFLQQNSAQETITMDDLWSKETTAIYADQSQIKFVYTGGPITAHDFLRTGRFNHIHLPIYPYVPPYIIDSLGISTPLTSATTLDIWSQCHNKRREASKAIFTAGMRSPDQTHTPEWMPKNIPWITLLQDISTTKTFPFDDLDIIQYQNAWLKHGPNADRLNQQEIYDYFFRPLERLFSYNMPLSKLLFEACQSKEASDKLATTL